MIKSTGIGSSPSALQKSDQGNDAAILAALVDSLRSLGEAIHFMKKFVGDYESGIYLESPNRQFKEGRINQSKLNEWKDNARGQYELLNRYRNIFSRYVVKLQREDNLSDSGDLFQELEFQIPGKFQVQSRTVMKDFTILSDEIMLRTDNVEIKVKNLEVLPPFRANDYRTLMTLYRDMGFLTEIKDNKDNYVEVTTIYHRSEYELSLK